MSDSRLRGSLENTQPISDVQISEDAPSTNGSFPSEIQAFQSASSGKMCALSPIALRMLLEERKLSPGAFENALLFLGIRPDLRQWSWFWYTVLSLWGALFLAAGIICFFAYNWADMHYFVKFGIIAALIALSGAVALWRGLDSMPGRLGLVLASLCVGPLLAVYGQVYQTGADAWELFRVWTFVVLPLALVGRQNVLWLILWLVGSFWSGFYILTLPVISSYSVPGLPEFFVLQILFIAGWEAFAFFKKNVPGYEWLNGIWFPRVTVFSTLTGLTIELIYLIFTPSYLDYSRSLFLPETPTCWALYISFIAGGWAWYRYRRQDLFMLSCFVFSLATLVVSLLIKAHSSQWETGSFLFFGLFITGITTGCGYFLRYLQQQMNHEEVQQVADYAFKPIFFEKSHGNISWDTLWAHLTKEKLLPEGIPVIPTKSSTPWYILLQLTIGGWIAAIFLICFLGFFLYMTLGIRSEPQSALLVGGLIFLAIGCPLLQKETVFLEQFGLAMAMAGSVSSVVALVMLIESRDGMFLVVSITLSAIYPFVNNVAFRYLAAVFALLFFIWGLDMVLWKDSFSSRYYNIQQESVTAQFHLREIFHFFWYAVLSIGMGIGWFKERDWRGKPELSKLLLPLLHAVYCVLLLAVLSSLIGRSSRHILPVISFYGAMSGIGAGCGVICLVWLFTRDLSLQSPIRWLFLGLAVLATAGGWYLPGLTVGLLGLTISRYRSDAVTLGLAIIGLIAYFFYYYYNLHTTLLHKSITLSIGGVLLCLAGFVISKTISGNTFQEESHA